MTSTSRWLRCCPVGGTKADAIDDMLTEEEKGGHDLFVNHGVHFVATTFFEPSDYKQ
eukprot:SAG22_NODE_7814_length_705_cov_1.018152_3_plen_56_part_01